MIDLNDIPTPRRDRINFARILVAAAADDNTTGAASD
jgi:hypothetical protein